MFDLYNREFLQQSVSKKLINLHALALASDGTPFVTSARERRHRVCDCVSKGTNACSLVAPVNTLALIPSME